MGALVDTNFYRQPDFDEQEFEYEASVVIPVFNREKTIADASNYIDLDQDILEMELYGGYGKSYPDPDKKATLAFKDVLLDLEIIEDYDIEPYYNLDIYRKALDSILEEYPDDPVYLELDQHFKECN